MKSLITLYDPYKKITNISVMNTEEETLGDLEYFNTLDIIEDFTIKEDGDFIKITGKLKDIYIIPTYFTTCWSDNPLKVDNSKVDSYKIAKVDKNYNRVESYRCAAFFGLFRWWEFKIFNTDNNPINFIVLKSKKDYAIKYPKTKVVFNGKEAINLI